MNINAVIQPAGFVAARQSAAVRHADGRGEAKTAQ